MDTIINLIPSQNLEALGWTLIHSVWQAALVAAILFVANKLLQFSDARLRYALSVAALVAVVAWAAGTYIYQLELPETQITRISADEQLSVTISKAQGLTAGTTFRLSEEFDRGLSYFQSQIPLIVLLWLIGSLIFTLRFLGGVLMLGKLRAETNEIDEAWLHTFHKIKRQLQVNVRTQIRASAKVAAPAVIGTFKPLILVPIGFFNGLSTQQVETVLAHELAHIKRHDFTVNLLQSIAEALLFFNPFVWWISNEIRRERENCCDDIAVKATGASYAYAEALLEINRRRVSGSNLAMGLSGRKSNLLGRVKRLFPNESTRRDSAFKVVTAGLLIVTLTSFYFYSKEIQHDFRKDSFLDWTTIAAKQSGVLFSKKPNLPPLALPPIEATIGSLKSNIAVIDTPRVKSAARLMEQIQEIEHKEIVEQIRRLKEINLMRTALLERQFQEAAKLRLDISLEELRLQLDKIKELDQQEITIDLKESMEVNEQTFRQLEEIQLQIREQFMKAEEEMRRNLEEEMIKIEKKLKVEQSHFKRIEEKLKLLEKDLRELLFNDGYIKDRNSAFVIAFGEEEVHVNDNRIKNKHYSKYAELKHKYLTLGGPIRFERLPGKN